MKIDSLVRENIRNLTAYSSARDEFTGQSAIFLDANENPYGKFNRYPDPHQNALKNKIAALKNIPPKNIFIGNGSDEVIDLTLRIFCQPGKDKIIICPPTYGMYRVSAETNDVGIIEVPLNNNFQLDLAAIEKRKDEAKVIFLCSPNNPTGNLLNDVEQVVKNFKGIVFLDEAYADFSSSMLDQLQQFPNLIISQTLSKAWGLAGLRVGLAFAGIQIMNYFKRVKPPYNVSMINQQTALQALKNKDLYEEKVNLILSERDKMAKELEQIPFIKTVYPSDSNFILISCENADNIYQKLVEKGIVIRNRSSQIKDGLRISIGTKEENRQLIKTLKEL